MSSPEKTEWTHEAVVRRLAGEMYRSALWAALGTVVAGAILWTVLAGVPGLVAALIGGAIACLSSAGTLLLMHRTAAMPLQVIMVAAFGGFLGKLILLFAAATSCSVVDGAGMRKCSKTSRANPVMSPHTSSYRRTSTLPESSIPA